MDSEKANRSLRKEFIKSAAIMVLAMLLLITAVVAWFTTSEASDVSQFSLSVETEGGGIYLGDGVAVKSSVVLPCATKVDDQSISYMDFSKAIYVETFKIKATEAVKEALISVSLPSNVSDLHYYVEGYYDASDTDYSLAEWIKDEKELRDSDLEIKFSDGNSEARERTVAVVFWAEYTDSTSAAIMNGNMTFDALVEFSVVE